VTDSTGALARRSRLPANPESHLARLLAWLPARFAQKYRSGQARHGGELAIKPRMLHEAENEFLDGLCYILTIREQLVTARRLVDDGLRCDDAVALADALEILDGLLEVPA